MKRQKGPSTRYILIDTHKCEACWKCYETCKRNVIGRVNLFFHKHAKIDNAEKCTGCLLCVKACRFNAIFQLKNTENV
jgi:NAD-dependent dihydropyrimidine dehydrogenase PreA subunit